MIIKLVGFDVSVAQAIAKRMWEVSGKVSGPSLPENTLIQISTDSVQGFLGIKGPPIVELVGLERHQKRVLSVIKDAIQSTGLVGEKVRYYHTRPIKIDRCV